MVFDQTNNDIYVGQAANCGTNEQTLPATAGAALNFKGECSAAIRNLRPVAGLWAFMAACFGVYLLAGFM